MAWRLIIAYILNLVDMALTQYFYHTDPSFRELNIIMAWMLKSGAAVVYKIFVCGAAILYIALHSDEQYAKIASWIILIFYLLLMAWWIIMLICRATRS